MNCFCKSENVQLFKEGEFTTGYFCNDCGRDGIIYYSGSCCGNQNLLNIRFEQSNKTIVQRIACTNCKSLIGGAKKRTQDFSSLKLLTQERFLEIEKLKKDGRNKLLEYLSVLSQQFKDYKYQQRYEEYSNYLKTDNWKRIRKLVLERDQYLCQGCRTKKAVHVHHTTYDFLGDELLFQLISLCVDCHQKIHPEKNIL